MVSGDFKEYDHDNIVFSFRETLPFNNKKDQTTAWLHQIIEAHQFIILSLNYIFCTDEELYQINVEHLNHDSYTDIITFDYSDKEQVIESDVYVSLDRVKDNASELGKSFDEELHRVLIHGVLHLVGYNDKTDDQKAIMREKENTCLSLRQ